MTSNEATVLDRFALTPLGHGFYVVTDSQTGSTLSNVTRDEAARWMAVKAQ